MAKPKATKIPRIVQLPSGSYFCRVRVNGEDISITDVDYNVVEAKAYAYKAGLIEEKKRPLDMTLRKACEKYINENRYALSPTTVQGYEKIVRVHFQELMKMSIGNITSQRLSKAVAYELSRPSRKGGYLSSKTVKKAYSFVLTVLKENGVNIEFNYKFPEDKEYVPVIAEPDKIYAAVKGTAIELPVLLAMWFSFTISEIRGLTKSKSIHGDTIVIEETVVDVNGVPVRKRGGKEKKRTRAHKMPPYIKQLIDNVETDEIVTLSGQAISKRFTRLMSAAGIERMSFHKLRHVNASVMARLQLPTNIAMERGGWSTEYTMKRIYTHTFRQDRLEADEKVDAFFANIIGNENGNEI